MVEPIKMHRVVDFETLCTPKSLRIYRDKVSEKLNNDTANWRCLQSVKGKEQLADMFNKLVSKGEISEVLCAAYYMVLQTPVWYIWVR